MQAGISKCVFTAVDVFFHFISWNNVLLKSMGFVIDFLQK